MKARTICCNRIINISKGEIAKNRFGEFLVCDNNCKKFMEEASERQIKDLITFV